jgi:hypothetical protein
MNQSRLSTTPRPTHTAHINGPIEVIEDIDKEFGTTIGNPSMDILAKTQPQGSTTS